MIGKEFIWLVYVKEMIEKFHFMKGMDLKKLVNIHFKVGEKLETKFIMHKYIK